MAFDRDRPCKRKPGGTPKKRARRANGDVDESVKEAMSESEEQLAKLTLDCPADVNSMTNNYMNDTNDNVSEATTECGDIHNLLTDEEVLNTKGISENTRNIVTKVTDNLEILTDIAANKLGSDSNATLERNGVLQTNEDKRSNASSKQSSAQVSPGSGSVKLSLFQPLNGDDDHIAASPVSDVGKLGKESNDNLYDFRVEETSPVPIKKTRGKPKGSKNKVQSEKVSKVKKKVNTPIDCKENDNASIQTNSTILKPTKNVKKKKEVDISTTKKKCSSKEEVASDSISNKCCHKEKNGERVKRKYVRKQKVNHLNNASNTATESNETEKDEVSTNVERTQESSVSENTDKDESYTKSSSVTDEVHNVNDKLECTISKTNVFQKCSDANDQEKQMIVNSSSLQEPVTPLYGETPKMNESNQGLPCSPNMESLDNNGRLVIDMGMNTDNVNSDKSKENSDRLDDDIDQSNGDLVENSVKNVVSNCSFSKEIFRNSYGPSDINSPPSTRNSSEIPLAHNDPFRQIMNGLSPTNALNMLGGFSPPLSAHLHMSHVTVNPTGYQIHDPNCEQPLDLTNSGGRDEYTKGKIFKTKMVKKSFPKQDSVQHSKDKNHTSTFLH